MPSVEDSLAFVRGAALPWGDVHPRRVWVRQQGELRLAPGRPWLRFRAEQWCSGLSLDFRWRAAVRMAPLCTVRVADAFESGCGRLTVCLFGLIPLARSRGPDTDRAEAHRGLAELPWRPFAFRPSSALRWQALAAGGLRALYDDGRRQAAVDFEVAADGHILAASTPARPRIVGKSIVATPWSGVFRQYRRFDRVLAPTVAEAVWHLPDGPFLYWRARVVEYRLGL